MHADELIDMFAEFGPVSVRRMFGGHGIYHEGRIIAIESFDEIWLKADSQSAPEFQAARCRQWSYEGKGPTGAKRRTLMPYWSVPDAALDDPFEFADWARKADAASRRAEQEKTVKPSRRPS